MNVMILNLMMAHFIGDFYCQYKRICDKKIIESTCFWNPTIFFHSLIIGILSMMFLCDLNAWTIVLSIFISHYIIDLGKSFISRKYNFTTIRKNEGKVIVVEGANFRYSLWLFIIDQILHIATIYIFVNRFGDFGWQQAEWLSNFTSDNQTLVKALLACIIAGKPANILVQLILREREVNVNQKKCSCNFRSGALIGFVERCLILTFVILSKYEAIGFLLGAKSILRFSQTQGKTEDEKSEYVLAGTLVSLAIALGLGLMVLYFPL